MSFFCATTVKLLSVVVVTNLRPKDSNVGGLRRAASRRSESRTMASGLTSEQPAYWLSTDNVCALGTGQLSCAGAPVFDAVGELAQIIDVHRHSRRGDECNRLALTATDHLRARGERLFEHLSAHIDHRRLPCRRKWPCACSSLLTMSGALCTRIGSHAFAFLSKRRIGRRVHVSAVYDSGFLASRRHSGRILDWPDWARGSSCWNTLLTPPPPQLRVRVTSGGGRRPFAPSDAQVCSAGFPAPEARPSPRSFTALKRRICDASTHALDQKIACSWCLVHGRLVRHLRTLLQQSVRVPHGSCTAAPWTHDDSSEHSCCLSTSFFRRLSSPTVTSLATSADLPKLPHCPLEGTRNRHEGSQRASYK